MKFYCEEVGGVSGEIGSTPAQISLKIPSSTLNAILAKRKFLESACNDGNSSTRKRIQSGNFVAQTLRDQLLAAQRADPEIQLLLPWVTSGSWPTQCSHEYSRDFKMMWQQGLIWTVQEDLIFRHHHGLTAVEGATQSIRGSPRRTADPLQDQKPILLARDEWGRTLMVPHVLALCGEKKTVKKRALMQPMTAGYPLQRVGMDNLGPLEKTPSDNRYVLVLTDYFTKWTAAFPLTNMEADTVAK
ncbi:hypothetical protein T05_14359, partial [Trichinella murrelli]